MGELNLKFDKAEFEEFKRKNFQERLKFIDFLAEYIRKTPNKIWSKQQAKIINSQVKGTKQLSTKELVKFGRKINETN